MDNATVQQFADSVKTELGLRSFDVHLRSDNSLYLNMLAVAKGEQKQGTGSAAMERLVAFADANGLRITLTTGQRDPEFGTSSQSRLITFYKRFGFVHNSGRNKDFSISGNMYRDPKMKKQTFREYYNTNLSEAPLEDYQTHGDWSKAHGFRAKRDRMLIQHPRAIEMAKKKFGNTEHIFRFYFVNSHAAKQHVELGLMKLDWVSKNIGEDVAKAIAPHMEDDSINVIFTNNTGDERRNMSAWIMAHRIGHALASQRGDGDGFGYREAHNELIRNFSDIMQYYTSREEFPSSERDMRGRAYGNRDTDRKKQLVMLKFFHEVGGFRSAREGNIRDWFEVMNELIAQYLTTGKIKFRPAPKSFGSKGLKGFNYYTDNVDDVNDHLEMMARDIGYYIDNALGAVANRILVM